MRMAYKQQEHLRALLTDAIIDLCRQESFYVEELRIEGTICIVSDRSSVVIAQITEQVGEKFSDGDEENGRTVLDDGDGAIPFKNRDFNAQAGREDGSYSNDSQEDSNSKEGGVAVELSTPTCNAQTSCLDSDHLDNVAMNVGLEVAEQLANIMSVYSQVPKSEKIAHPGGQLSSFPSTAASAQEFEGFTPHGLATGFNDHLTLERSADGKFKCPYCVKSYGFKHTLKEHINKHLGRRPHVCKHCGDSFTHLASLCAHVKKRHADLMPMDFQCSICHEKLMNYQSLKQHYTWRHKDAKFPEDRAAQQDVNPIAPNDRNLEASLRPMRRRRPHHRNFIKSEVNGFGVDGGCADGQKKIKTEFPDDANNAVQLDSSALLEAFERREYENIQEGIDATLLDNLGLDSCYGRLREDGASSVTGAGFQKADGSSDTLQYAQLIARYFDEIYIETDNGVHRYRCKFCSNTFKVRNSLYEHLNSHFGKRPHTCGFCGDSFAHHSSLHNHVRNKHSFQTSAEREASFKHFCLGCERKFRYRSELERHLKCNPEHALGGMNALGGMPV